MKLGFNATKKNTKFFGFSLLILIVIIILFVRIVVLLTPENEKKIEPKNIIDMQIVDNDEIKEAENIDTDKKEDVKNIKEDMTIYHMDHSIYNGTGVRAIAQKFAEAIDQGPIKEEQVDACCGGFKHINYELQNDNHFVIELFELNKTHLIIEEMSLLQSAFHKKNGSYDIDYAKTMVLKFTNDFLLEFDVELGDDYEISAIPWGNRNTSWKVEIYQTYKGEILNWTGFEAHMSRENGEIRVMNIYEWLDTKKSIIENISIDKGRMMIYNNLKENGFNITPPSDGKNYTIIKNLTDIEYVGYTAIWGRLGLTYEISYQINETKGCLYQYVLNIEDGKILYKASESEGSGMVNSYYNNLL